MREIVKGCSLIKPHTSGVTIVWSDEVSSRFVTVPDYPHLQIGPMSVSVTREWTYKENERNMPTAAVSVWRGERHVGSWNLAAGFPRPVSFEAGGKNYQNRTGTQRFYKPFAIQLIQFSHDRYAGTDIPKNFSSRIRLLDPFAMKIGEP